MARQNNFKSYGPQSGDSKQLVVASGTEAPLLEYLLNNVKESRNKIKATLQGRGIKVNGKVVTQFDLALNPGDKVSISRHKISHFFRNRRMQGCRNPDLYPRDRQLRRTAHFRNA